MSSPNRQNVSQAIAHLMPRIIQGVHLDFMVKRTITQTQFLVLVAIHSSKRSSMNFLAKNMQVSMPTISGIVDRLVKAGFIKRSEDPQDRRQVMVELTTSGQALITQFQQAIRLRWNEVLKSLSEKELVSFYQVIIKLSEQLQRR
jgi:DNA-binding MarR family transcriptional regulator